MIHIQFFSKKKKATLMSIDYKYKVNFDIIRYLNVIKRKFEILSY